MTTVPVLDTHMQVVESGSGSPVVFLHGNPTSSYLWRNVTGRVAAAGYRCLAVDLIGMGNSGRSLSGYRLIDHIAHVEGLIEALELEDFTFVAHDWGVAIALDITRRLPGRVRGAAIMEGHLHPIASWASMDPAARQLFRNLRTEGVGERMVLHENMFVEVVLPSGILRELSADEMDTYRKPFTDPRSREPMLAWAREIPIEGEPADVTEIVARNCDVLRDPAVPTLLLHGNPGVVVDEAEVRWCRTHGRSMSVVDVGAGLHFLPEDQPGPIAEAIVAWSRTVGGSRGLV